jgi:thymidine phosphorylase
MEATAPRHAPPAAEMIPQEVIRSKRDGDALSDAEIDFMVSGISSGVLAESQIGAFAMAVFLRGMTGGETRALTAAMARSGTTLRWDGLHGPVVDKHSTGGVGDSVSLMLAPAIAACGGYVPMISGRGLGHTGGTLDKLESIPGYRTQPDLDTFSKVVGDVGCAIIGQTPDLAPADKRLYAVRDVTATVESVPLITASILSKKLAAGLDALVMNVTWGNGAFMTTFESAEVLARSIVDVASLAGVRTSALLTDMSEPLASAAGNALEVRYAVDYLTGARREPRLHELVIELGADLLMAGELASTHSEACARMNAAVERGEALERFDEMVMALGGPPDFCSTAARHLPACAVQHHVVPGRDGFVTAIDTRQLGLVVVQLGGGRTREDQSIDHAVGLTEIAAVGQQVGAEMPLAIVHARDESSATAAADRIRSAYTLGGEPALRRPLITRHLTDRCATG